MCIYIYIYICVCIYIYIYIHRSERLKRDLPVTRAPALRKRACLLHEAHGDWSKRQHTDVCAHVRTHARSKHTRVCVDGTDAPQTLQPSGRGADVAAVPNSKSLSKRCCKCYHSDIVLAQLPMEQSHGFACSKRNSLLSYVDLDLSTMCRSTFPRLASPVFAPRLHAMFVQELRNRATQFEAESEQ